MLKVIIISGPSGSGNTSARYVFEELGYKIVENAPVESLNLIVDSLSSEKYNCEKLCLMLAIDLAKDAINLLKDRKDISLTKIILTSSPEAIRKRYALSRHAHPYAVSEGISLNEAIEKENSLALECESLADFFIDTSSLTAKELKSVIYEELEGRKTGKLTVQFTSFGIKYDRPKDLDMFFDVRSIPNPFWVAKLKELTGKDQEVQDYMLSFDVTGKLLERITEYLTFLLEAVSEEGRVFYNIGFACTGGQHRSVFVAEYLQRVFKDKYHVLINHRDLNRG